MADELDIRFDDVDLDDFKNGEQIAENDDPLDAMKPAKKSMVLFFVIDVSTSMQGEKIDALNRAMSDVLPELVGIGGSNTDIKIAVLEFSSGFEWKTPEPISVENYQNWVPLRAEGVTDLGAALLELNEKMSRKVFLQSTSLSYAPVVFLVTDGYPTDDYRRGIEAIRKNNWFRHGIKIALAIGDGVDKDVLAEFTGDSDFVVEARDVKTLLKLVKMISVTSSQIGSNSIPLGGLAQGENADSRGYHGQPSGQQEIEEEAVDRLKQERMKGAMQDIRQDIMMAADGSNLDFDEGW